MEILSQTQGDITVLIVQGKLDAVTAPAFEQKIRSLVEGGATRLIVDLGSLEYISSAGLRGLLLLNKLVKTRSGRVGLAAVQGNVRSVFEMSGFSSILEVHPTAAAALEAFR